MLPVPLEERGAQDWGRTLRSGTPATRDERRRRSRNGAEIGYALGSIVGFVVGSLVFSVGYCGTCGGPSAPPFVC